VHSLFVGPYTTLARAAHPTGDSMSDTPRTDEAASMYFGAEVVEGYFARALERELAAVLRAAGGEG